MLGKYVDLVPNFNKKRTDSGEIAVGSIKSVCIVQSRERKEGGVKIGFTHDCVKRGKTQSVRWVYYSKPSGIKCREKVEDVLKKSNSVYKKTDTLGCP